MFSLGFRAGTGIARALGGSASYQRSTNLIVAHLIGTGSFVLGLVQGLSRPLTDTQINPHTDSHCLVIITIWRISSGSGVEEVCVWLMIPAGLKRTE